MTETPATTVKVEIDVNWSCVTNAITGCMEGPYSPWMHEFRYKREQPSMGLAETARNGEHTVWYNDPGFWTGGGQADLRYDGEKDEEGSAASTVTIGQQALLNGLNIMAAKAPKHFADLVNENDDAITHDVFMQMVVFGEIIYG